MRFIFSSVNKSFFKSLFNSHLKSTNYFFNKRVVVYSLIILSSILLNCSSSKRFTSNEDYNYIPNDENIESEINTIRILLDERPAELTLKIGSNVHLYSEQENLMQVDGGDILHFYLDSDRLILRLGGRTFSGKYFQLIPVSGNLVECNNKSYKGNLRIVDFGNFIDLINFVDLENYLKGVIAKEMPLGKGEEHLEALKAFAICARTYALVKMNKGKSLFDIFSDTRDQVYEGKFAESTISNKAVDETEGMILTYHSQPAIVYYHSTCGGENENVENVFPQSPLPYLISIKDGIQPYCSISPRFEWEETYSEDQFIEKLYNAKLISNKNYSIEDIQIVSTFSSGRVEDLKIVLSGSDGEKEIHLYGNEIRSKIRSTKKNQMLWSTMFTVERTSNGNIVLEGKGFGHGVGLCQWGAIGQSKQGIDFKTILEHYFPGTTLGKIND